MGAIKKDSFAVFQENPLENLCKRVKKNVSYLGMPVVLELLEYIKTAYATRERIDDAIELLRQE